MPLIIFKEKTAHLASCTFFTRDVDQYKKTRLFHSSINHQEHFFHRTLITSYVRPVNIANSEYLFYRTPPETVVSRCSSKQVFLGKHLRWSLFLKNVRAEGLQLHKKRLQHRCFPVGEIFKNTFFYRTLPVAVSVFLKKSTIKQLFRNLVMTY